MKPESLKNWKVQNQDCKVIKPVSLENRIGEEKSEVAVLSKAGDRFCR